MSNAVVITGCSSGFGRVTALHLAQRGRRVFATIRKEADRADLLAEGTKQGCAENLFPVICDITNAAQIAELGRTAADKTTQLEGLVNNAGTAFPAPLELITPEELRSQLEINVIGHMTVTQTLLPLLKAGRGKIINVTSVGGRVAMPVIGAYNASKFAMEALSDVLRIELAPLGVRVVVIEPGSSATEIWKTSRARATRLIDQTEKNPYLPLLSAVEEHFKKQIASHGFPPELFAETVLKILNSPNPRARYRIPAQVSRMIFLRAILPDRLWDRILRKALKW